MRRTISIVLVAAMLLSVMIFAPTATSAATLDTQNVAVNAYYFGGTLLYTERNGLLGQIAPAETTTVRSGDASKGTINIDGIIENGEWGDPNITISSEFAANNGGKKGITNQKFETASAENSYFYLEPGKPEVTIGFTSYFLWDEDYFYVAAHVVDPDYFCTSNSGKDAWNGDALQFRIDYQGPNSAVGGTGYSASDATFPWAGSVRNADGSQEKLSTVGNFIFAYTTADPGYTECWDAAPRWNVSTDPTTLETTGNQRGLDYMGNPDNPTYAVAYPRTETTDGVKSYVCEYEIAIPWAVIGDVSSATPYTAAAGAELGMSMALLNGKRGEEMNSYLEWGSGVCGSRTMYDSQTCGGSNSVTLSSVAYNSGTGCDHDFADPTCIAPYTCTKCGYEKGYKSGHSYVFSNTVLPTATTDGSIDAYCPICGDSLTKEIPAKAIEIKHSFKTTDTSIIYEADGVTGKGFNDGWSTTWKNPYGAIILDKNGVGVTSFDTTTFGYAVSNCNDNGSAYDATCNTQVTLPDETTAGPYDYHDQTGTYFSAEDDIGKSFTVKMDLYITEFNDISPWTYTPGLYQLFGGADAISYFAGVFKVEGDYYFAIISRATGEAYNLKDGTIILTQEEFEKNALSFTKVSADTVSFNEWHEFVFMHDDASATAALYWDDVLVASATDPHLAYTGSAKAASYMRRMGVGFYAKDMYLGSSSLASEFIPATGSSHTLTINYVASENDVPADQTITVSLKAGDSINEALPSNFYKSTTYAYRFFAWSGDTACLTDTTYTCKAIATGTMPDSDVTLTAVYKMVGDVYEDGLWNGKDGNAMTQIIAGESDITFAADINYDGLWNGKDGNLMLQLVNGDFSPQMVSRDEITLPLS